jgi:hypothetical protein
MTSELGLKRPAGEVLVLVAAGLGVAASALPSVVGTIASLDPGRSLLPDTPLGAHQLKPVHPTHAGANVRSGTHRSDSTCSATIADGVATRKPGNLVQAVQEAM